jgi:hypothetical protein
LPADFLSDFVCLEADGQAALNAKLSREELLEVVNGMNT